MKPCVDCKVSRPHYQMQWDHLPEHVKTDDVSSLLRIGKQAIIQELKKCELVCVLCHAERTWQRKSLQSTLIGK